MTAGTLRLFSEGLALWLAAMSFVVVLCGIVLGHPPLRRVIVTLVHLLSALAGYLRRRLREGTAAAETAGPIELRLAFERLGPTYIKLGQLIASSSGLFPPRYCREFQRCLDRVPPEPWSIVEATLLRNFRRDPKSLFASIEPTPLASASIAQVYGATRGDEGQAPTDLVIKIQRSGLSALVSADVGMLGFAADLLQQLPRIRYANPRGIVQQFQHSIFEELDFRGEAQRMDEFNTIMQALGRTDVCAPRPVWSLTTHEVLVMERLRGVRVDDLAGIAARGLTPEQAESKLIDGMHAWFQCLIRFGFFHGDVHAGNLLLLDDGRIGFLDFGIIGRLSIERRRQVAAYLLAFSTRDFETVARTMAQMGAVSAKESASDWRAFATDLEVAYAPFLSGTLSGIDYSEVLGKMIRVSRRHGTRLPDDFILILRQLLYFDRYARLLAPSLNLFADPRLLLTIGSELSQLS